MFAFRSGRDPAVRVLRAATLALSLAAPGVAAATPSEAEEDVSAWVGRYCTPLGCAGAAQSALGNTFGFGAAALTVGWLARRRRA